MTARCPTSSTPRSKRRWTRSTSPMRCWCGLMKAMATAKESIASKCTRPSRPSSRRTWRRSEVAISVVWIRLFAAPTGAASQPFVLFSFNPDFRMRSNPSAPALAIGRFVAAVLLTCSAITLEAVEKLPLEIFAKFPAIFHPVISRDGKTLCYGAAVGDERAILFKDLDGGKNYAMDLENIEMGVGRPRWVAENRVVYGDIGAMDRD